MFSAVLNGIYAWSVHRRLSGWERWPSERPGWPWSATFRGLAAQSAADHTLFDSDEWSAPELHWGQRSERVPWKIHLPEFGVFRNGLMRFVWSRSFCDRSSLSDNIWTNCDLGWVRLNFSTVNWSPGTGWKCVTQPVNREIMNHWQYFEKKEFRFGWSGPYTLPRTLLDSSFHSPEQKWWPGAPGYFFACE